LADISTALTPESVQAITKARELTIQGRPIPREVALAITKGLLAAAAQKNGPTETLDQTLRTAGPWDESKKPIAHPDDRLFSLYQVPAAELASLLPCATSATVPGPVFVAVFTFTEKSGLSPLMMLLYWVTEDDEWRVLEMDIPSM